MTDDQATRRALEQLAHAAGQHETYQMPEALDWLPAVPDHVGITHQNEFGPVWSDGIWREFRPRS